MPITNVLEISVNVVFTPMPRLDEEDSMYEVVTRDQVILDIHEEIKRRIEDNISEVAGCTPIIAHKLRKGKL